ncbi:MULTISPECIES: helix-turn-helix transcriptional regulator [unclassified Sulfitobacter]|uniref:helix-turn-helix domain-containing protein n=2 Tax=Sulfitobacter TaxID=60136 RepID=UPI0023E127BB|nr:MULTISPECIES: helix-turn-helix transcriptional regulator [unclassified Sulfitobacter]
MAVLQCCELNTMPKTITSAVSDKGSDPRVELGGWLKSLREAQGLSQRKMAEELSLDYYTFISQLETGRGKIPSARYGDWAKVLDQQPKPFMKKLLSYYEPEAYEMLFGDS